MWNLFKAVNLFWVLSSSYLWVTSLLPQPLLLVTVNACMIICMGMLPFKIELGAKNGIVLLVMTGLAVWATITDGWILGIMTFLMYLPAQYLIILPYDYKKDLLHFVTKWYSILIGISLGVYFLTFVISLPSLGYFKHPVYNTPFINYLVFIQTTYDTGYIVRFNGFFLEPGHQALCSTFLLMANKFDFKKKPLIIIPLLAVIFSFSLAGYLLAAAGYTFLKINSFIKALILSLAIGCVVGAALVIGGGDNTLNNLIISRLEYDEADGIKGNNRFYNNTDFEFKRALGTEYFWKGVKGRVNMKLIGGAGFKIYILNYGMIGALLALVFYISVIPSKPDFRFTISFLLLIMLCFLQRSYPFWYSWIFPYVLGIYIAKGEKESFGSLSYDQRSTQQSTHS